MSEGDSVKRKISLFLGVSFTIFGLAVLFWLVPETLYLGYVENNLEFSDELSQGDTVTVSKSNASLEMDTSGEVWTNEITQEFGDETGTHFRKHRRNDTVYLEVYHIGSSSVDLGTVKSASIKDNTAYIYHTREDSFERTADMNYRGTAFELETSQNINEIELAEHTYRDELLPALLRQNYSMILNGRWNGEIEYQNLE